MQMQEPEQQPVGQEWQANQEYGEYRAEYTGRYEPEQQKIYPQEESSPLSKALWIVVVALSSLGFFLTVAGIIGSAVVLKYANGQVPLLAGGLIGLLTSIFTMLVCVAIFVLAVVSLAQRVRRVRRWTITRT